ncbi:MAG: HPr-rel-A system PqqD family peptide chaperone [Sphingobium sp.]
MTGAGPLYHRDMYHRDRPDALLLRPLDGLTLIFHRPSGMSHIVDSPVPEILAVLGEEPKSAAEILAALGEHYDLEDGEDAMAGLIGHLDALCGLGLVRGQRCAIT